MYIYHVFIYKYMMREKVNILCINPLPFGANGINLINEYNGWSMLFCHTKQFPYQLGTISLQLTKLNFTHNTATTHEYACTCTAYTQHVHPLQLAKG